MQLGDELAIHRLVEVERKVVSALILIAVALALLTVAMAWSGYEHMRSNQIVAAMTPAPSAEVTVVPWGDIGKQIEPEPKMEQDTPPVAVPPGNSAETSESWNNYGTGFLDGYKWGQYEQCLDDYVLANPTNCKIPGTAL